MSLPPGQPRGSGGGEYGPSQRHSRSAAKRRWPRRHPVWSALIAIVGLLIIIGAMANPQAGQGQPYHGKRRSASSRHGYGRQVRAEMPGPGHQ